MPRYEYRCEQSGQVVEVEDAMSERRGTWGGWGQRAVIEPGSAPASAPIEKVISLPADGGEKTESGRGAGPSG